jgi:hypothetical protein
MKVNRFTLDAAPPPGHRPPPARREPDPQALRASPESGEENQRQEETLEEPGYGHGV